ncbi:hypothetical protein VTI74DRAFT_700 [Chaetomium olivicolor]
MAWHGVGLGLGLGFGGRARGIYLSAGLLVLRPGRLRCSFLGFVEVGKQEYPTVRGKGPFDQICAKCSLPPTSFPRWTVTRYLSYQHHLQPSTRTSQSQLPHHLQDTKKDPPPPAMPHSYSSICPCSSCFAATQQHVPAQQYQQPQQQHFSQPEYMREKKGGMFNKLRRTPSIGSTTSTLVGLMSAAEPMAGKEKF